MLQCYITSVAVETAVIFVSRWERLSSNLGLGIDDFGDDVGFS